METLVDIVGYVIFCLIGLGLIGGVVMVVLEFME